MDAYRGFSGLGWMLIVLGVLLVALPYVVRAAPSLERVPWYILWVYRRDGFTFVTSPLLILLSVVSFLLSLLRRGG